MVEMLGRRLEAPFFLNRSNNAVLAHYAPENLLLVKPDTYNVKYNLECMRRVANRFPGVEPLNSIIIYHEPDLPLGEVEYLSRGSTMHNQDLHQIALELKTERFPRIAVGIEYPEENTKFEPTPLHLLNSSDKMHEKDALFLHNKFPRDHWIKIHRTVVPKVFGAIDQGINEIRERWPITSKPDRPERPEVYNEVEDVVQLNYGAMAPGYTPPDIFSSAPGTVDPSIDPTADTNASSSSFSTPTSPTTSTTSARQQTQQNGGSAKPSSSSSSSSNVRSRQ